MKFFKYALSSLACNAVRLMRLFPNNDPIMAFMLPFSRQEKWFHSTAFVFISMFLFDLVTSGIGVWTWVTAFAYAGIGFLAHLYFNEKQKKAAKIELINYFGIGLAGVLLYDFVTGVLFGPVLFGVPFWLAFFGQIPFTLMHLASVSIYIVLLTPFLDRQIVSVHSIEDFVVLQRIKLFVKSKFFSSN